MGACWDRPGTSQPAAVLPEAQILDALQSLPVLRGVPTDVLKLVAAYGRPPFFYVRAVNRSVVHWDVALTSAGNVLTLDASQTTVGTVRGDGGFQPLLTFHQSVHRIMVSPEGDRLWVSLDDGGALATCSARDLAPVPTVFSIFPRAHEIVARAHGVYVLEYGFVAYYDLVGRRRDVLRLGLEHYFNLLVTQDEEHLSMQRYSEEGEQVVVDVYALRHGTLLTSWVSSNLYYLTVLSPRDEVITVRSPFQGRPSVVYFRDFFSGRVLHQWEPLDQNHQALDVSRVVWGGPTYVAIMIGHSAVHIYRC